MWHLLIVNQFGWNLDMLSISIISQSFGEVFMVFNTLPNWCVVKIVELIHSINLDISSYFTLSHLQSLGISIGIGIELCPSLVSISVSESSRPFFWYQYHNRYWKNRYWKPWNRRLLVPNLCLVDYGPGDQASHGDQGRKSGVQGIFTDPRGQEESNSTPQLAQVSEGRIPPAENLVSEFTWLRTAAKVNHSWL